MKQGKNLYVVFFLILFLIVSIFIGHNSSANTKLVTIHIEGMEDSEISKKIESFIETIEGIQTVFIDEKASLCTFRYDSGKIDFSSVENQFAGLGIEIKPVESINLFDDSKKKDKSSLFTIKIEPASGLK